MTPGHCSIAAIVIGASMAIVGADLAAAQQTSALRTLSAMVPPGKHERPAPTCPTGERFLVSHVHASPAINSPPQASLNALQGVRWGIKVLLRSSGDDDPSSPTAFSVVQLIAIGLGVTHVEASLPSGQALPPPDAMVTFSIFVLDPIASSGPNDPGPLFNVHVSGFCGVRL